MGGSYLTFPASWKIQYPGHQSPLSQDVMSDTEAEVLGREEEIALDSSTIWSVLSSLWTSFALIFHSALYRVHSQQSELIPATGCVCTEHICVCVWVMGSLHWGVAGYVTKEKLQQCARQPPERTGEGLTWASDWRIVKIKLPVSAALNRHHPSSPRGLAARTRGDPKHHMAPKH